MKDNYIKYRIIIGKFDKQGNVIYQQNTAISNVIEKHMPDDFLDRMAEKTLYQFKEALLQKGEEE